MRVLAFTTSRRTTDRRVAQAQATGPCGISCCSGQAACSGARAAGYEPYCSSCEAPVSFPSPSIDCFVLVHVGIVVSERKRPAQVLNTAAHSYSTSNLKPKNCFLIRQASRRPGTSHGFSLLGSGAELEGSQMFSVHFSLANIDLIIPVPHLGIIDILALHTEIKN